MRQDPAWSHVSYGIAMGLGLHLARTFAEAEHVDRVRDSCAGPRLRHEVVVTAGAPR
jgi:hypothetical protein